MDKGTLMFVNIFMFKKVGSQIYYVQVKLRKRTVA